MNEHLIKKNYGLRFFNIEIELLNINDEACYAVRLLSSQLKMWGNDYLNIDKKTYSFMCSHTSNSENQSIKNLSNNIFNILNNNVLINRNIGNFIIERH